MPAWLRVAAASAALLMSIPASQAAEPRTLTLVSGEAAGIYLPVGGAVCRIIGKERDRHGLRCLVEPSAGSAANIAGLRSGEADLAIVQSRAQRQAFRAETPFAELGAFAEMRTLASLQGEAMVVLTAKAAKIKSLREIKGRKVSIGRANSFQRLMAEAALGGAGVGQLPGPLEMDVEQQKQGLCDGQLEVAFFSGPQPMTLVQEALRDCDAQALDLRDVAAEIVKGAPFLAAETLPADLYDGIDKDITTVAMKAVLATTTKLPDEVAYEVVRALLDNFEALREQHRTLARLERKAMPAAGVTAPLHAGAVRAYKEAGVQP